MSSPSPDLIPLSTTSPLAPQRVYRWFSALTALAKERFSAELGGKLLLYAPLNSEGAAVALAGNIAGAATLGIDSDGERLRQGIRHAYCDFLVNNLDEALRILKNEVRKKQPVSVCLEGDFASELDEMTDRGVQPDILAFPGLREQAAALLERGAVLLAAEDLPHDQQRFGVSWSAALAPALWLPKVDALAASMFPAGDERSRWLKLAPRYLGRAMAGLHFVEMTAEEAERFEALVGEAEISGALGVSISVQTEARK